FENKHNSGLHKDDSDSDMEDDDGFTEACMLSSGQSIGQLTQTSIDPLPSGNSPSATVPPQPAKPTKQTGAWAALWAQKKDASLKRKCDPEDVVGFKSEESKPSKKARVDSDDNRTGGKVGISKGAMSQKASRIAADNGDVNPVLRAKWKKKILAIDKRAGFNENPGRLHAVRCSNCGKEQLVSSAYNISRFRKHYHTCQRKNRQRKKCNPTAQTNTLTSSFYTEYFKAAAKQDQSKTVQPKTPPKPLPCPGLGEAEEHRIPDYLRRTGASGGGARSIHAISKQLFKKKYRNLTRAQKSLVIDTQTHEHRWRNDQERLRKPTPLASNYKYINKMYRNQILGEQYATVKGLKELIEADTKTSPFQRFSVWAIEGKFDNHKVFLGLVEAMMQKVDQEEHGVGMQNFAYAPAWDEFSQIVALHSPRAHQFLREHFPTRTRRNMRVKEQFDAVNYTGPAGVACDDTKLLSGLRLYFDAKKKQYLLIGGTDGPLLIPDPETIHELMNDPTIPKGTKIRVWVVQIPLPGMLPIVVTAIPISDGMTAEALLPLTESILFGLQGKGICVISYATDGAEVERSVQRMLISKAHRVEHVVIPSPVPECSDESTPLPETKIAIPFFNGEPIVMIQDSKHAMKTFRNNLFSGARLLVLGNHVAHFRQVLEAVSEGSSPMLKRDVGSKLDRQDDNAAARLYAAATLEFLIEKHPEMLGLIVYLFVLGELCDAWQNREIGHDERLKLVLRARYFAYMWQNFLNASPIYSTSRNYISRKANVILHTLIDSLVSLIVVHRDWIPETVPLLPWLHSSEGCEHIFGMARQLVQDFTMMDFVQMIPKLRLKMREALLRPQSSVESNAKSAASGYNHMYLNPHKVDILKLSVFPSERDYSRIATSAAAEADSLIMLLGLNPSELHPSVPDKSEEHLPGIETFFRTAGEGSNSLAVDDDDGYSGEEGEMSERQELRDAVAAAEELLSTGNRLSKQMRHHLETLTNAALAVAVDDEVQLSSMLEPSEEDEEENNAENRRYLREVERELEELLLPEIDTNKPARPHFGLDDTTTEELSLDSLIAQRLRHQTQHAALAVCSESRQNTQGDNEGGIRRRIISAFYEDFRTLQEQGVTTGEGRQTRWKGKGPEVHAMGGGAGKSDRVLAGNTANAAAVATDAARKAASKRRAVFAKLLPNPAQARCLDLVKDARVSAVSPITLGSYGFVHTQTGIMLGHGMLDISSLLQGIDSP
ncbi:hypothetical protein V5O48_018374, partial [Marasmius crinis-equi]